VTGKATRHTEGEHNNNFTAILTEVKIEFGCLKQNPTIFMGFINPRSNRFGAKYY
jgi:hypothetical protein